MPFAISTGASRTEGEATDSVNWWSYWSSCPLWSCWWSWCWCLFRIGLAADIARARLPRRRGSCSCSYRTILASVPLRIEPVLVHSLSPEWQYCVQILSFLIHTQRLVLQSFLQSHEIATQSNVEAFAAAWDRRIVVIGAPSSCSFKFSFNSSSTGFNSVIG